jgi:hypothetical protein
MKIMQSVKALVAKLPPDILQHPLPLPDRLDYAEKLIQEWFDKWNEETLTRFKADYIALHDENIALRRECAVMESHRDVWRRALISTSKSAAEQAEQEINNIRQPGATPDSGEIISDPKGNPSCPDCSGDLQKCGIDQYRCRKCGEGWTMEAIQ